MGIELKIGEYYLSAISVPTGQKPPYKNEPHIFIRHKSGEAMSVQESILAALIDKFYKENF